MNARGIQLTSVLLVIYLLFGYNSVSQDSIEVSNIFTFTPSKLLKKGQVEMQLYNNLYTQTAYRNGNREKVELDTRDTSHTVNYHSFQLTNFRVYINTIIVVLRHINKNVFICLQS